MKKKHPVYTLTFVSSLFIIHVIFQILDQPKWNNRHKPARACQWQLCWNPQVLESKKYFNKNQSQISLFVFVNDKMIIHPISAGPLWSMSAEEGCVNRLWPSDTRKPLEYTFSICNDTNRFLFRLLSLHSPFHLQLEILSPAERKPLPPPLLPGVTWAKGLRGSR